jgi:hypothetical protein
MRLALFAALLLVAAWAAPAAAQFDPGQLAQRLKPGMTITDVILVLGNRPTSTEETACRWPATGELFTCRIWDYATEFQALHIYFRYDPQQRQWVVYSWEM